MTAPTDAPSLDDYGAHKTIRIIRQCSCVYDEQRTHAAGVGAGRWLERQKIAKALRRMAVSAEFKAVIEAISERIEEGNYD